MKDANLVEPKFEMGGFFTVIFYRPMVFDKWLEGWNLQLTIPLVKMLKAIYDEERITKPQLASVIGQSKTSVDNNKFVRWVIHQLPPPQN